MACHAFRSGCGPGEEMKEAAITFGSIVAILFGGILLYYHVYFGPLDDLGHQIGAGAGVVLLAAGITGLWAQAALRLILGDWAV
jgi:hypothetical protein